LDIVTFLDQDATDFAADLCNDCGIGECFYGRGARVNSENVAASRGSGLNGDRRRLVLIGVRFTGARLARSQEKCR
jgi:hypothetical protein